MQTVEELQKKHEEEMRELKLSHEIIATLPRVPVRVLFADKAQPWIIYDVKDLREALKLSKEFPWADYVHAKGTFTSLQPASRLKDEVGYKCYMTVGGGAPYIDLETIEQCRPSATLCFFTDTLYGKTAKVVIHMEQVFAYIGVRVIHEGRDRYSHHEVRKDYPHLHEDEKIQWASGGPKSAKASYVWYSVDSFESAMSVYVSPEGRKETEEETI